jgi:hypothetical protein
MPIDLAKYGLTRASLNRKDVMDSRQKGQRWPTDLVGNHKDAVLGYRFVPPSKETKNFAFYQATLKILESTNPAAVGRTYPVSFVINGDPMYQHITDASRAQFVAAALGDSSDRPDFDCDKAEDQLMEADEKGELKGEDCKVYHTTTSKTKQKAVLENGVAKTVGKVHVNHFFNPVK